MGQAATRTHPLDSSKRKGDSWIAEFESSGKLGLAVPFF